MIVCVSRPTWSWNDRHLEWLTGATLWAYLGDEKVAEIVGNFRDSKSASHTKAILALALELSSNEELQKSLVKTIVEKFPSRWSPYGIEDAVVDVIVDGCGRDLHVYAEAALTDGDFALLKRELRNALMKHNVATQVAELVAGALLSFVASREGNKAGKE